MKAQEGGGAQIEKANAVDPAMGPLRHRAVDENRSWVRRDQKNELKRLLRHILFGIKLTAVERHIEKTGIAFAAREVFQGGKRSEPAAYRDPVLDPAFDK